jgi:methylase of polypeptide subunit release factors
VPTTEEAVKAMLKLADVQKSDIVYDLGCGDGRIVIAAAKEYGARGVGIDINPERIQEAEANAKKAGVEKLVRFEENDLFNADIHEATVVTCSCLIAST